MTKTVYKRHYESRVPLDAPAEQVFAHVDDHANLSSHMNKSSWMMGGSRMNTSIDDGHGQRVGSHIRMSGKVFGTKLFIKIWETVGDIGLLIIGHYRMGIEIEPQGSNSLLRVYIDYDLPAANAWLGRLFGGIYAQWCVQQMIKGASEHFSGEHA